MIKRDDRGMSNLCKNCFIESKYQEVNVFDMQHDDCKSLIKSCMPYIIKELKYYIWYDIFELIGGINMDEKCFCGSGKKRKKCHPNIEAGSKLADIYLAFSEFDKIMHKNKLIGRCPSGCHKCCNDYFTVDEFEFLLILDYLMENDKDSIYDFLIDSEIYKNQLKKFYPNVFENLNKKMSEAITINEGWSMNISCIFLKEGKCSIYKVRPYICRAYGTCYPCSENNSIDFNFDKKERIIEITSLAKGSKGIAVNRAYPLSYYFTFALNDKYRSMTLTKLKNIRKLNESDYADHYIRNRNKMG